MTCLAVVDKWQDVGPTSGGASVRPALERGAGEPTLPATEEEGQGHKVRTTPLK